MSTKTITIEAIFADGVFRPLQPLALAEQQQVTLTVQVPAAVTEWPPDVAAIYRDIAEEDRRLATTMWPMVEETWPQGGEPT